MSTETANPREAVITGIGLVTCRGEDLQAHFAALDSGEPAPVDAASYAPFAVHPLVKLELDRQIPRKGDQRQMEQWQRTGTYAAGVALEQAGVKGDADLLARTDMIVAATGGERDVATDEAILAALPRAEDRGAFLNARLNADLRPTLFLAQLPNLLAGNISIVHGVVGSSRSFLGEESAGADALRIACARIAAGQSDIALVGAAFNAQRPEILLPYALTGTLHRGAAPGGIWARQSDGGGMVLGSAGCFLVVESRAHAAARGASPLAAITAIATDRTRRNPGEATQAASAQWESMRRHADPHGTAILSGASGVAAPTAEEAAFLRDLALPVRAVAGAVGHPLEAAFPVNVALAVAALRAGRLFAPLDPAETPMEHRLRHVLVTGWGHARGEAMALLSRP
jgi:3-oxoacyl-[acyl-carrier-protein] synthase II